MKRSLLFLIATSLFLLTETSVNAKNPDVQESYEKTVLSHKPIAYWKFSDAKIKNLGDAKLEAKAVGKIKFNIPGPRPSLFSEFSTKNTGIRIRNANSVIRVKDPGENSPLDFTKGDAITLEAWINPEKTTSGQMRVILAKGRNHQKGFARDDLNYALRFQSSGRTGKIDFLFRSDGEKQAWHRWTSKSQISCSDGWHHIVLQFEFGKKSNPTCYIDGKTTSGIWTYDGATDKAPVNSNNDLWIGSAQGGRESSTFRGEIDEVAIYRRKLTKKEVRSHFQIRAIPLPVVDKDSVSKDHVFVELFESITDSKSWVFYTPKKSEEFKMREFAFVEIPQKYSKRGIRMDRPNPILMRATRSVTIPKGKQRILLRSRNSARLFIDGKKVVETPFHNISSSAHGTVFEVKTDLAPNIRPLSRGDHEKIYEFEGDGKEHLIQFQMIVGGQGHRLDFGETSVSIAEPEKDFQILGSSPAIMLTDESWLEFAAQQRAEMIDTNQERRLVADIDASSFWEKRHILARDFIGDKEPPEIPAVRKSTLVNNAIDQFIGQKLETNKVEPNELINDLEFLRRVSIDSIGTIPSPAQIQTFLSDSKETRRAKAIDRLLEHPGWADNWVGYWQDVLAENPNIIKPTLNNSGAFRWWIHESFLDNKSFDRFATELIMMEGSKNFGGTAGFEMASQNDVPMAAKAHIISQAFLGLEMKCARCHDAPFRSFKQRDLFSLAAMLRRKPQEVPKSSTIPGGEDVVSSMIVEVTLKAGEKVAPEWSFTKLINAKPDPILMRDAADTREQVAALITSPANSRFAKVIVNRLWKRYLGWGLAEPVDDWETPVVSHPELLEYLAHEFIANDYDLKHIASLIFNSHLYQRKTTSVETAISGEAYLFAAPLVRRMSAEQVVDSMFAACEKDFNAGQLSVDIDGAMRGNGFHLGVPTRSWHFASLSNERDRPSLALPFAQPFISTLETFGWRSSRQDPLTIREETTTAVQPAVIGNGILSQRVTVLSDDNAFTKLAMEPQPLDTLIEKSFLRMLCRKPTASEKQLFTAELIAGYETRVLENPPPVKKAKRLPRDLVSWSNHLNSKANEIKVELERAVQKGDTPTNKLDKNWRLRMEDMVWALLNSPEFIFIP